MDDLVTRRLNIFFIEDTSGGSEAEFSQETWVAFKSEVLQALQTFLGNPVIKLDIQLEEVIGGITA